MALLHRLLVRARAAETRAARRVRAATGAANRLRAAGRVLTASRPPEAPVPPRPAPVGVLRARSAFDARQRAEDQHRRERAARVEAQLREATRAVSEARRALAERRARVDAIEARLRAAERDGLRRARARREDDPPAPRRRD